MKANTLLIRQEGRRLDFNWAERGMSFQFQFIKKLYKKEKGPQTEYQIGPQTKPQTELQPEPQPELQPELNRERKTPTLFSKTLIALVNDVLSKNELSKKLGQKSISGQLNKTIVNLLNSQLVLRTIPDKPTSSKQKYKITEKGNIFLKLLRHKEGTSNKP